MPEKQRLNQAQAIRKEVLVTRIELRREQLMMSADNLRAVLRGNTASDRLHPVWQTLMTLAIPCGAYFASGRRAKLSEAVKVGLSLAEFLNRVIPRRQPP
jgi:hypothetical protein